MPNGGLNLEKMFNDGLKRTTIAQIMAIAGTPIILVFVVGLLSTYGLNGTLWGLWISILWLNVTIVVFAFGAQNQNTAITLALRGAKDESQFTEKALERFDKLRRLRDEQDRKKET